jgi:hypothetical protein
VHRVDIYQLVRVDIWHTHTISSQFILAIGSGPDAMFGLNRLSLLGIPEKGDGEATVGLEVIFPGEELVFAVFCP